MSVDLPARIQLREAVTPADGIVEGPRILREPQEEYELFALRPLSRVIGAEIDGVDLPRAERIREIVALVQESGVGEITIEDGDMRVTVRRTEAPAASQSAAPLAATEPSAPPEKIPVTNTVFTRLRAPGSSAKISAWFAINVAWMPASSSTTPTPMPGSPGMNASAAQPGTTSSRPTSATSHGPRRSAILPASGATSTPASPTTPNSPAASAPSR